MITIVDRYVEAGRTPLLEFLEVTALDTWEVELEDLFYLSIFRIFSHSPPPPFPPLLVISLLALFLSPRSTHGKRRDVTK